MKKNYQKPQANEIIIQVGMSLLAGSPTGTNQNDLGVDASNITDAEGHSRSTFDSWDDEY